MRIADQIVAKYKIHRSHPFNNKSCSWKCCDLHCYLQPILVSIVLMVSLKTSVFEEFSIQILHLLMYRITLGSFDNYFLFIAKCTPQSVFTDNISRWPFVLLTERVLMTGKSRLPLISMQGCVWCWWVTISSCHVPLISYRLGDIFCFFITSSIVFLLRLMSVSMSIWMQSMMKFLIIVLVYWRIQWYLNSCSMSSNVQWFKV